ncbi:helix-turn-helix domain-containing protein [Antarcticirhabdus aurantiaca]|uniref:Helix-turn-helix transcriptional regulator n=1 Tax=Antarcticirhabdus aurantiaca TaxID=2606717 RepID=A0ACD4NM82_9HYPH|nr:helix-turn-helix transcriptional regulator [Antarcticirhabdus aurantiaca]WAJ27989.1 helix-turn-helix transcriptional regulator [Jeongeuplla avenae]
MSKLPVEVTLGRRLQQLREARSLSAAELGRSAGLTYQQIRKYETGANRISAATLYRLALHLDVDIDVFFDALPRDGRGAAPGGSETAPAVPTILSAIDDPEVRRHFEALLQALAARR